MTAAWIVFLKELKDALRDRRTLITVLLSSVAVGPVILFALSVFVAGLEQRGEVREATVAGIEHAPTLANYLRRQTYRITPAPAGYEHEIAAGRLDEPVLVVGPSFEAELARGDAPLVEIVSSSANARSQSGAGRLHNVLRGFSSERATLTLALRGVAPALLEAVDVQDRDLAGPRTRAAQFTGMLPFFVLMAVLYGALHAALDTTAGERERGSLEPLLVNPAPRWALVVGKWGAAAAVGMLIAAVSGLSFLPARPLIRSETLAALFQFGPREAALFLALLAPLAAALAALMMAIAIRSKTFKEAQANNTVLVLGVSLLPLLRLFNQSAEAPWHVWVPALGQIMLMDRVLKGDAVGAADVAIAFGVCVAVAAAALYFVARQLTAAAVR